MFLLSFLTTPLGICVLLQSESALSSKESARVHSLPLPHKITNSGAGWGMTEAPG